MPCSDRLEKAVCMLAALLPMMKSKLWLLFLLYYFEVSLFPYHTNPIECNLQSYLPKLTASDAVWFGAFELKWQEPPRK